MKIFNQITQFQTPKLEFKYCDNQNNRSDFNDSNDQISHLNREEKSEVASQMLVIRDNFISDPSSQKTNTHQHFNFPDIADSPRQIQRIEHVDEIKNEQSYGFNEKAKICMKKWEFYYQMVNI
jgi:hypothetical protein